MKKIKYNNVLFKLTSSNMAVASPLFTCSVAAAVIVPTKIAKLDSFISVDVSGKLITTANGTFLINVIQS